MSKNKEIKIREHSLARNFIETHEMLLIIELPTNNKRVTLVISYHFMNDFQTGEPTAIDCIYIEQCVNSEGLVCYKHVIEREFIFL